MDDFRTTGVYPFQSFWKGYRFFDDAEEDAFQQRSYKSARIASILWAVFRIFVDVAIPCAFLRLPDITPPFILAYLPNVLTAAFACLFALCGPPKYLTPVLSVATVLCSAGSGWVVHVMSELWFRYAKESSIPLVWKAIAKNAEATQSLDMLLRDWNDAGWSDAQLILVSIQFCLLVVLGAHRSTMVAIVAQPVAYGGVILFSPSIPLKFQHVWRVVLLAVGGAAVFVIMCQGSQVHRPLPFLRWPPKIPSFPRPCPALCPSRPSPPPFVSGPCLALPNPPLAPGGAAREPPRLRRRRTGCSLPWSVISKASCRGTCSRLRRRTVF